MQKYDYLNRLIKTNCVVVVRGNDAAEAVKTVDAVIAGGITGIELTFTVPHADRVLDQLSEKYGDRADVLIGAGTVLDPATARLAIIAGAKFIVSPSFTLTLPKSVISMLFHILQAASPQPKFKPHSKPAWISSKSYPAALLVRP